MASVISSH